MKGDGFILAAAIRADAELVWEGRSQHYREEESAQPLRPRRTDQEARRELFNLTAKHLRQEGYPDRARWYEDQLKEKGG